MTPCGRVDGVTALVIGCFSILDAARGRAALGLVTTPPLARPLERQDGRLGTIEEGI
jgi:hypothetical protein